MNPVELLLADDHKIMRDGIRAMLESRQDYHICGEASSGREVLEHGASLPVDLVLMDLNMPDIGGVEATRKLRNEHPEIAGRLHLSVRAIDAHRRNILKRTAARSTAGWLPTPTTTGCLKAEWNASVRYGS